MKHYMQTLIEESGLTIEEFANNVGVSRQSIYNIIAGRTKRIRTSTAFAISKELLLSVSEIKSKHEEFVKQYKQEYPSHSGQI